MGNTAICLSYDIRIRKSLENGQTTSLQAFISPLNACAVSPAGITRLPYCAQQPPSANKKANRLAKQLMRKALTCCKPICLILSV
jgi:hypothetical protein